MCLKFIWIASSFVSLSFPFVPFSFFFSVKTTCNWILNQFTFDGESNFEFHLFNIWFVVSSSFVSLFCSFLPLSFCFFNCPFCSTFRFPFLSCLDHQMFQFSDNLSDNLLLKKGPRRRDRLIWSQKEEGLKKKWAGSQHYATTLYWDLGSLMRFSIATNQRFFIGTIGLYQILFF